MINDSMRCENVDELLPDWMDGSLDEPARARVAAHLAGCARCTAVVRDLDSIVADAGRLPVLAPSRDLWSGIADRIAAPVIVFPTSTAPSRRPKPWWMTGVAAAALVLMTAGVTHVITRRSMEQTPPVVAGATPIADIPAIQVDPQIIRRTDPAPAAATPTREPVATPRAPSRGAGPAEPRRTPNAALVARAPMEAEYDRQIAALREVFRAQEGALDPGTVAVIERSLSVIDAAIAEARAALARDPGSSYLQERLTKSLDKKVGLLRTATALPARS